MKVENEMALPITKSVTVMLLEPYAGKLARTVLRGESSRKGADLLDNSVLGNVLCADIQLEEGVLLKELDIRCQLKNKLQDFKIPRRIKFVESFTLTRTGKLKRL